MNDRRKAWSDLAACNLAIAVGMPLVLGIVQAPLHARLGVLVYVVVAVGRLMGRLRRLAS